MFFTILSTDVLADQTTLVECRLVTIFAKLF